MFYRSIILNGDSMSKEGFKVFARSHPELISSVMSGDTSWQKLYELYDIYGDDNEVWSKYITNKVTKDASFKDVFNNIKNIDMDSFQKGINNLQKTIGLLQGFGGSGSGSLERGYTPRNVYRHMED